MPTTGTQEKDFESHIEAYLTTHGYHAVAPQGFDRALALVPAEVLAFVQDTQPTTWAALQQQHGAHAATQLLQRLAKQVQDKGVLPVLREGFKMSGQRLHLAYFRPASGLNPEHGHLYQRNRFGVLRQVRYATAPKDTDKSLDLVLTLNGLPLLTAELKNALTGQYLSDAIRQYREDRNPQEPLLQYRRCLVHFAVSTEQVYMTTKLAGEGTHFLPFNQDVTNPANPTGFTTAYLWEDVWATDSLLELAQYFVFEQTTTELVYNDKRGELEEQKSTRLLFPRYHQRRAVRRLLAAVQAEGAGGRYLIKHSAGSGKSNTLSWLAHRLAGFYQHPLDARPLFDSVIVVTDRRLLNKQLSDNVKGFEQTTGVIFQVTDATPSAELRAAIEGGRRLILTTLQRFPVISATIGQVPGRRYAVLIDEAHSSQSGESARHLKRALSLADAEQQEADEPTLEDEVLADIARTGPQPNVSYFAFTATPKPKTIELFGTRQAGHPLRPFDEYTMRQAIKEGFILDVLRAYTSFRRYYKLATKAAELGDKEYEKGPAVRLLSQFVDLTDHAIELKARLMLSHFQQHTQKAIKGRARAMVVTRSRLHAVRYKRKFDEVMLELGLPYQALVAFSGTVRDPDTGEDYTEVGMNGLDGKASIEAALKLPQFRLLIVANKFQTGFDEPLLHTMYVDKKLGGINTVQTLSRLNRTTRHKDDTLVLDFVNDPAQVQADFQEYYHHNLMSEEDQTDPNALYDVQDQVLATPVVTADDLDRFADIYLRHTDNLHLLQPILETCVARFLALDEAEQDQFRVAAGEYVRLYRFLSQLLTFRDVDLAKLYYLLSHLVKKLPPAGSHLPREVLNDVKLDSYKLQEQGTEQLSLDEQDAPLQGLTPGAGGGSEEVRDYLSAIIKTLNDTFGLELTEADKVDFEVIRTKVETNADLTATFTAHNSRQNIEAKFSEVLDQALLDFIDTKLDLYNKLSEDKANAQMKRLWFKAMLQSRLGSSGARPAAG